MRFIVSAIVFLLTTISFAASKNGIVSDVSSIAGKNAQAYVISSSKLNGRQSISEGDIIYDNDLIQIGFSTVAAYQFDGTLLIELEPLTVLGVVYSVSDDTTLQAMYELLSGRIWVQFDASKYEDDELAIKVPFNDTVAVARDAEFSIDSKGYVKVNKGIVSVRRLDDLHRIRQEKIFKTGEFGSFSSPVLLIGATPHRFLGTRPDDSSKPQEDSQKSPFNSDLNKSKKGQN